jgi:hypothetical protein
MNEKPTTLTAWLNAFPERVAVIRQAVAALQALGDLPAADAPAEWDLLLNFYRSLELPAGGSSDQCTKDAARRLGSGLAAALGDGEAFLLSITRSLVQRVCDPKGGLCVWPLHHFAHGTVGCVRDMDLDWIALAPWDAMVNDCPLPAHMKRDDCIKGSVCFGPAIYKPAMFGSFDHCPVDWYFCDAVVATTRQFKALELRREQEAWRRTHGSRLAQDEQLARLRAADPRAQAARIQALEQQVAALSKGDVKE